MAEFKEPAIKVDTVGIAVNVLLELHLKKSFPHFSNKEIFSPIE